MQFIVIIIMLIKLKFSAEITCGRERYSVYSSQDDAGCYWITETDDLPLFVEKDWIEDSIFFIDPSCKGGLNIREACSVEAAAKVNPTRQVNVLFTGPITQICIESQPLASLKSYENINLRRIYVNKFANNTEFGSSLEAAVINEGPFPNLYTLDLLKFITLYKFGGVYMDLDMMATRPFDELPRSKNWVGVEDHNQRSLSTAIFAASSDAVGRRLVKAVTRVLKIGISSEEWSFESFNVLRAAVEQIHGRIPFEKTKNGCSFIQHGLVLYASKFFFPIHCEYSESYFNSKLDMENLTKSFTQQLCNGMTFQDDIDKNSVYAQLMSKYCPNVYNYFSSINFYEAKPKRNKNGENDII